MMFVIIVYTNWFFIYHRDYTTYREIKQQCCWAWETLPQWCGSDFYQCHVYITTRVWAFFIVHLMNYMQPSTSRCFSGGMKMILLVWCWDCCRNFWISLKQNCGQHLTLVYVVYHTQQIWFLLLQWDTPLLTPPFSLLPGICYDSLQHTNNFCYWAGICLQLTPPMVSAVCHDVLSSPLAVSAGTQGMCYNFYMVFYVIINIDPANRFACK